jgi:diguanylate cyclase
VAVPSNEHERTLAFAEIALQQIRALRLPASPRNFEIWYQYASGYSPGLNRTINDTLAQKGTLEESDIERIYDTYLSPGRVTDRLDSVGSRMAAEITQVLARSTPQRARQRATRQVWRTPVKSCKAPATICTAAATASRCAQ